jgi:hypothetical protein
MRCMSDMKVTKSRESKTYVFVSLLAHVRVSLVMKSFAEHKEEFNT